MEREQVIAILEETGVLHQGHFRLTSGRHSDVYLQCARVLQHPDRAGLLCQAIAEAFSREKIDAVVGPATGAIIIAYEVARALGVRAMFTERDQRVMTLRRGFAINPGEKVLAVEDVITTGGSVQEVLDVVVQQGGIPAGVGALVDRSGGQVHFSAPMKALVTVSANTFNPEDCPLCRQGIPIVKPGSRQG